MENISKNYQTLELCVMFLSVSQSGSKGSHSDRMYVVPIQRQILPLIRVWKLHVANSALRKF